MNLPLAARVLARGVAGAYTVGMADNAVTVVYEGSVATVAAAVEGDALWLAPPDLAHAAGWDLKPQGLCRGPLCVPIPAARQAEFVRPDGRVNLAALAGQRGQTVVHDDARAVWVFGRGGEARAVTERSLLAPDFTLPDLDGRLHSLSETRGKKVLLASWASW
jgi:hypothetical protein